MLWLSVSMLLLFSFALSSLPGILLAATLPNSKKVLFDTVVNLNATNTTYIRLVFDKNGTHLRRAIGSGAYEEQPGDLIRGFNSSLCVMMDRYSYNLRSGLCIRSLICSVSQ
ncbi:hypothetical protein BKA69DRAFT_1066677 [Paraphysoderma sedebokerense]|nr:hypothetical protein BKA69DRAFT_1066620 [Paraphysoderma sedebokerense]KAI9142499.1 hypothetical protein BKA69DRAFT_1066677 [Paraphysoderma sedebokerense]